MMRALVVALCAGAGALELAVVSLAVPKASERYGAAGRAWRWKSAVLGDDMAFPAAPAARRRQAVVAAARRRRRRGRGARDVRAPRRRRRRRRRRAAAAAARACLARLVLRPRARAASAAWLDSAGGEIAAAAAAGVPAGADAGDLDGAFATRATTRAAGAPEPRSAAAPGGGPGAFDPFSSRRADVLKQARPRSAAIDRAVADAAR
ncbi:hypothetical protein SO694_00011153 [Aureococcus anophagefferens]|uniref:Uncharacterized protein n=1 Tax=Aureococcus anophagefferens TaxID=44056 RepID=A0ABR1GEI2_AURAN